MRISTLIAVVVLSTSGCLPYAVGMTAATVPRGDVVTGTSTSLVKGANALRRGDVVTLPTFDVESRYGINTRTDYGVRVTSLSGVVGSLKRRLDANEAGASLAGQAEVGVVNLGQHVYGGVALMASTSEDRPTVLYGGARLMAVAPIVRDAVYDRPTAGGFAGMRVATASIDLYPELGVYHDHSALELRTSTWIVVPSLSLRLRSDHIRHRPRVPRRPPWERGWRGR